MKIDRHRIFSRLASLRKTGEGLFGPDFWRVRPPLAAVLAVSVIGTLVVGSSAHAATGMEGIIGQIVGWFLHYLVAAEGWLLVRFVGLLVWVAQYNGFVDAAPVATGWFIVRDIVNMFFILILLVIAFGTILGVDTYNYKKALPKLLISAVIVNFSRTFCGLIIDFAQVIMLTFVNGFSEAATGNFANAFKIVGLLNMEAPVGGGESAGLMEIVAGWILAAVLLGISLFVVIYMTVVLMFRIVILWVLIVISPLAFFLRGVPMSSGSKYYGEWWGMFLPKVIVGPIMAFFLWLSLITVSGDVIKAGSFPAISADTGESARVQVGMFGTSDLAAFTISVCLLLGGMQIAQKMSGIAGKQIPGAVGTTWKTAKGAFKSGRKAFGAANRSLDYTPLGNLRDSGKEAALRFASHIPGAKDLSMKALSEHRAGVAKKGADSSKWLEGLTPDERARLAGSKLPSALLTASQRGVRREALKQHMSDLAKGWGGIEKKGKDESAEAYQERVRKEFQASRGKLKKLGEETFDKATILHLLSMNKLRPDLIVDPEEKDAEARKKQQESLRLVATGLGSGQLAEMEFTAMTPEVMMFASPKALANAVRRMNTSQLDQLNRMGFDTEATTEEELSKKIRAQQERLKIERPGLLTDSDRSRLTDGAKGNFGEAEDDLGKAGAEKAAAKTKGEEAEADRKRAAAESRQKQALEDIAALSNGKLEDVGSLNLFAAANAGGLLAGKVAAGEISVDAGKVSGELARQMAAALDGTAIGKLPAELADKLREALAAANAGVSGTSKILESGGTLQQALASYGFKVEDSSFSSLGAAQTAGQAIVNDRAMMRSLPADALRVGGGVNDLSMNVVSNVSVLGLNAMVDEGNRAGGKAVVDSAFAVRDANPDQVVGAYEKRLAAQGTVDANQIRHMADAYRQSLKEAQDRAQKMIEELVNDNSPLGAAVRSRVKAGNRQSWKNRRRS